MALARLLHDSRFTIYRSATFFPHPSSPSSSLSAVLFAYPSVRLSVSRRDSDRSNSLLRTAYNGRREEKEEGGEAVIAKKDNASKD